MIITNFLLNEIKGKLIFFILFFYFIFKKTKKLVSTHVDSIFLFIFIFLNLGLIFYKNLKI